MAQKFLKLDLALKCLLDNTPRAQEQCWLPPVPFASRGQLEVKCFPLLLRNPSSVLEVRDGGLGMKWK